MQFKLNSDLKVEIFEIVGVKQKFKDLRGKNKFLLKMERSKVNFFEEKKKIPAPRSLISNIRRKKKGK